MKTYDLSPLSLVRKNLSNIDFWVMLNVDIALDLVN
jgi:hypothetical protein